jgi:hypothetical protein
MHLHFLSMINVILTNKMPNLTENAKVLILSKLEEGWSIRRVAQHYYNIAQRLKQTILWCSKISGTFYVVKLIYLTYIKNMTFTFQKGIVTCGKNCSK